MTIHTASHVRITWPDGQISTHKYEHFCSFQQSSPIAQDILDRLQKDGFIILINEKHPGKRIRIDLTSSEGTH